ncbi:MAG: hypothetical protein RIR97_1547, partial [Pseudomonadota bacterium]
TGDVIRQSGLPRLDTFAYRTAGKPFITHEWLFEWLFWTEHSARKGQAFSKLYEKRPEVTPGVLL